MLGTACSTSATKVMMLGCGELGKEVVIELQRLGVEVIGVDRYANAPGMQVAHRSYVINMLDGEALRELVEKERPHLIVPEIEAIATDTLAELEGEGFNVIPSAKATQLTMNREGIRCLAANTLGLATSAFVFASTFTEFTAGIEKIGIPCVIKPIMSSSGKGQSLVRSQSDIETAWKYAQEGGRAGKGKVIIEGFVDFDYEITLLTISAKDGIHYCAPIGHRQEDGDYRESWQPAAMSKTAIEKAQNMAKSVVEALGGYGLFGVELFIKGDDVIFSEVSPRPHDTGLVTLISQDLSEFALHARAILGLPIHQIEQYGPSASAVILREGTSTDIRFSELEKALAQPQTQIRLFGKPEIDGRRRLGVVLKREESVEKAIRVAVETAAKVKVHF
ncbi:formate-dependent phosphoribosylglycinamide formyltransferase [Paraglaciecola sp.]|uniref:formate-dependent phosphoribosylglycinamide formyltransferase n=1 Tax=Paraglaciecola sp. TaxID=1920173 RepID=UPI003EF5B273